MNSHENQFSSWIELACTVPFVFLRECKTEMVLVPFPITFPNNEVYRSIGYLLDGLGPEKGLAYSSHIVHIANLARPITRHGEN